MPVYGKNRILHCDHFSMFEIASVLAALFVTFSAFSHEDSAEAQYLGNEGVLVSHGDLKVLFDAFYDNSYETYVLVASPTRSAMMAGIAPYNGVDALIISHVHGDHFSPAPTLAYLRAQSAVHLYGSVQVVDAVLKLAGKQDAELVARLHALKLKPGDAAITLNLGEIEIEAIAIPHSGGARMASVTNLLFRVDLDGFPVVMHMGDSDPIDAEFARQQKFLDRKHTHTAFPPYWFLGLDRGEEILTKRIKPDKVIGIHVPEVALGQGDEWREKAGGDLFTDPGESRGIGKMGSESINFD